MRLFLHGKSTRSVLLDQLHQLRAVDHMDPHLILWFSQWTFGCTKQREVEHQLMDLLLRRRRTGMNDTGTSSSPRSMWLTKVIVQNCHATTAPFTSTSTDDDDANTISGEDCSPSSSSSTNLWSILLHHTQSLTIRYDVQQDYLCLPPVFHDYCPPRINKFDNNNNNDNDGDDCYYHPLRELELEGVTLSEQSLAVLEELCSLAAPQLKRLYITSHWTTLEVNYQHRSILGNESDVEPHLTLLCQFLQSNCMSHLKVLELVHCHLVDSCLAELLKHVVVPVSLDSSGTTTTTTTTGTRMQLESLNLRGNMAKEKTLKVIAQSLLHPHCSLSHLDLGEQRQYYSTNLHHDPHCHPSPPPLPVDRFSVRMMEHLVEGIEGNHSLTSLSLAKNQFCSTTSLPNLLQALCRSRHRKNNNNVFQYLDLQDCGLSSRDVHCIAQALSQQLRLRSLDLRGQQRVSGQKIKRALLGPLLSSNPYLCKIQLPQNVESKSIEWLLEWNRIGRRAVLHVEQDVGDDSTTAVVPAKLWPALLERANHMCRHYDKEETSTRHSASAIYYLLRQGGCDVLSRSTENRADTMTPSPRNTGIGGGCRQDSSPPFSQVQSRAVLPLPPTPSTFVSPEMIRPWLGDPEEIELSFVVLEETSSFEKPCAETMIKNKTRHHHMLKVQVVDIPEPSGALERPRLSSTRGSPLSKNFVPMGTSLIAWGAE